jgi:hypothetical protein
LEAEPGSWKPQAEVGGRNRKLEAEIGSWRPKPEVGGQNRSQQNERILQEIQVILKHPSRRRERVHFHIYPRQIFQVITNGFCKRSK